MDITDEHVAAVRSYLIGDADEFDRLSRKILQDGGDAEYSALFSNVFLEAVRRELGDQTTLATIIRLVGDIRTRLREHDDDIDPRTAERVLCGALGEQSATEDLTEQDRARAQLALLSELAGRGADPDLVDEILTAAKARTEQM